MIERRIAIQLSELLDSMPAVALLGPRQVGKTTLSLTVAEQRPSIYLDLESDADRAKLDEPELYLAEHEDKLVILDEVHRLPNLFQNLRGLIDRGRRRGRKTGRFLLLGSASIDLLKQSGETLAGRIAYLEMHPIDGLEVGVADLSKLWVRGGFPDSFLATSDRVSQRWRLDFIRTYLERDIPLLGPRIPAETLRRFWTMLAHHQAGLLNAAEFARALGVDGKTVASYLDLLVDLLLVRRLEPWHANIGKRLVKSPRVYVRDSGIAHALLGLATQEDVLGHPVAGASWEGFVIETLAAIAPAGTQSHFYRSAAGAEIDLLLTLPRQRLWAIEIKRSLTPKVERGFYQACEDLSPQRRIVVYPGSERFPLQHGVEAMPMQAVGRALLGEA
ncbi:ATP-binding protein [Mesorhizobium sp.]|uniref:ATP-binding protein n=1 Tax=Mesorhizobium sp. TaxID=1871066 RepID=UPI000FE6E34A|nr:ATP-binding protein [Mesorhizobium sp.]RWB51053.1 MAG: ATP-binding protein [Mesorhizobium sp.]